ncbi:phage portal protein [uncultured Methylobacterium sp.]|jgi:lambda family phage portal protein|uniref:phage portal protein n=1 Tax=uncultured Methylobacterium sp. TaxID=157278 RepID=UPI0026116172|nr:phage portal protein [uncultured Methylobacterium sp.]
MSRTATALKALAWVAPGAAVRRAHALGMVDGARAYDGARVGRRGDGFTASSASANVEIAAGLARLRSRSRDLVRNTSEGARAIEVRTANTIGTGILAVPDNGSDRIDNAVKDLWAEWSANADVEGVNTFGGLQRLAWMAMLEGGDAVIRRIMPRDKTGLRVPLKLKLVEGDFIDTARDQGVFEGRSSRLGVGLGPEDERLGYWLHGQHPGDFNFYGAPFHSTFVPRSEVIHLFRPLRPGQVRGVPLLAPVLMNARDRADLMDAVLVKAKTEACFAVFVETSDGHARSMGDVLKDGAAKVARLVERLAPGMVNYLRPGEKASFAQPTSSGQFAEVYLAAAMAFAAGTGLTYDELTGDLRQANYSSLRAGKIIGRRLALMDQEHVAVPQMVRRTVGWFEDAAVMAGALRPRRGGYRWDYIMPSVDAIDPRKDLEADILAVRAGRMTPQEFIASWGQDWRKVVADFGTFYEVLDKTPGGIVFDIDARKTSQTGVAQLPPGGAYPTDPEKPPAD